VTQIHGEAGDMASCPAPLAEAPAVWLPVLQALKGLKMVEKDQDEGRQLTPQGQRGLDRIAGQVAAQEIMYN
uniref:Uncharacterized protein n=1 Tax=Equus asinus TaxID=9793 RepID=A0A8C4L292_EQUAS